MEWLLLAAFLAGEWPADLPESTRRWFKEQRNPDMSCCDMADGHPADWKYEDGHYWATVGGEWKQVPDRNVIMNSRNPTGRAVVWTDPRGAIRCFVPGPEG